MIGPKNKAFVANQNQLKFNLCLERWEKKNEKNVNWLTKHTYQTVINEFITPWLHKLGFKVLRLLILMEKRFGLNSNLCYIWIGFFLFEFWNWGKIMITYKWTKIQKKGKYKENKRQHTKNNERTSSMKTIEMVKIHRNRVRWIFIFNENVDAN